MHSFLEAIGFKELSEEKLNELLDEIIEDPHYIDTGLDSKNHKFVSFSKDFGEEFGISVCGSYLESGNFRMDYYYPYFKGKGSIDEKNIEVEKHSEKESYAAVCDDLKIGVVLIFYLQNVADFFIEKENRKTEKESFANASVTLSALCMNGKILFPISKSEKQIRNSEKMLQDRSYLIAAAREGDEDAIESLTLEDIDTYSMLSKRIVNEDILSIVDTYFMPYGIESDQYAILGEIVNYYYTTNKVTGEEICVLTVDTNDLVYDVCMNKKDLYGIPEIGRRFKGNIWMQGTVNFQTS